MTLRTSDSARNRGLTDAAELPANGRSGTLIDAIWPGQSIVRTLVLIAAGTILLALSAKFQVMTQPVPITLQTLAVMVIAAVYGPWLGASTVIAYLVEGLLGAPVFAGVLAGPAYMIGTTGGFLVGMVPCAFIVGWVAQRFSRSIPRLAAAMVVGDLIVFVLGFVWLAYLVTLSSGTVGLGSARAWTLGVEPFLLTDAVKIGLAACLIPACFAVLKRRR